MTHPQDTHPEPISGPPFAAEDVRGELEAVLASASFRGSRRSREFLRFVVEESLAGRADQLKERTIGVEVFGKAPGYDSGEDATVRIKAGEVRKRLGQHYAGAGRNGKVVLELPLGSYVPEFRPGAPAADALPRRRRLWPWAAAAILAGAAGFLGLHALRTRDRDPFWMPVYRDRRPIVLSASAVPVYSQLGAPPGAPPEQAFAVVPDQFVAVSDLNALLQISGMLDRTGHPYQLRVGKPMSFKEFSTGPAVLVGYSYSKWDELSRGFRYFIDLDLQPAGIRDNGQVTPWRIQGHPDARDLKEDYAIVTRVFAPDTRAMLVEVSGISRFGTEAAADFVTNPSLMAEAMKAAPRGWENRNVQIVLHVRIIAGSPAVPAVVAVHVW